MDETSEQLKNFLKVEYRDKEGKEITFEEWSRLMASFDNYKFVSYDEIGKYRISTVWLGIKHFGDMFFETMVFDQENLINGSTLGKSIYMHRYQTKEDAIVGHETIVDLVRKCVENGDDFEVIENEMGDRRKPHVETITNST